MVSGKNIFIAALDWGMGHATRCVPLIKELEKHNTILIGVTPDTKTFFQEIFPHLTTVELPGYQIRYSTFFPVWLKILFDWPRIKSVIRKEHVLFQNIVQKHHINCVISDNRYGLYASNIKNIFITHQLFIRAPFLNFFAQYINKKMILRFDEVWVPDYAEEKISLSGALSHGKNFHHNVKFIGPLSRLNAIENTHIEYDFLVMLSGPEPQHSLFAEQMLLFSKQNPQQRFAIVSANLNLKNQENILSFYRPSASQLSLLMSQSNTIVCRSGYSSLMDLHVLGKKKILLYPTNGQTEQEYLAKHWCKNFGAEMFEPKKCVKN